MKKAIYCGSFDPIHRNHLAVAQFLIGYLGYDRVYLIPNQANNLKPYLTDREHRLAMMRLAVETYDGLEVLDRPFESNWEGRNQLAQSLIDNEEDQIALVLGQDSYQGSVKRCAPETGIYAFPHKIIVLPRLGEEESHVREYLPKVEVVRNYRDPQECSSTLIRHKIKVKEAIDHLVLPSVERYILEHNLYREIQTSRSKCLVIMGPPASGKGTLGRNLSKSSRWIHLSCGDLYRATKREGGPEFYYLERARQEGQEVYQEALRDFIIRKLKQTLRPDKNYIIDGLKSTDLKQFEDQIRSVDAILVLHCPYQTSVERSNQRGRNEDIGGRLKSYYRHRWIQDSILKSYQSTGRPVYHFTSRGSFKGLTDRCRREIDFLHS